RVLFRSDKLQRLTEAVLIDVVMRGRNTQPNGISQLTELLGRIPLERTAIGLNVLEPDLAQTLQHRLQAIFLNPRNQREHLHRHLLRRNLHPLPRVLVGELEGPLGRGIVTEFISLSRTSSHSDGARTSMSTGLDDLTIENVPDDPEVPDRQRVSISTDTC